LSVFNMLGEKVYSVFEGVAQSGLNVFDFSGDNLCSGIYIYRLDTPIGSFSKKCVLLK